MYGLSLPIRRKISINKKKLKDSNSLRKEKKG